MDQKLFREKAVKRASSPEQLDEYIRVANPGIWIILLAVMVFLIGVCVWGFFGRLETSVEAVAVSDGETTVCYLADSETVSSVKAGQQVKIGQEVYEIASVSSEALQVKDCTFLMGSERARDLAGLSGEDWVYEIKLQSPASAGTYSARIVTESVSPMSFIFN